jgi:hypothetical protein
MTTLDELRRANLQEQKRSQTQADPAAGDKAKLTEKDIRVAGKAEKNETPVVPEPAISREIQAEPAIKTAAVEKTPAIVASEVTDRLIATVKEVVHDAVVEDEMAVKGKAVMENFYRRSNRKTVHPTGVKATIDMPPDLFWRVKRYCHDHNNITVRQYFLDLAISMLEEEGY